MKKNLVGREIFEALELVSSFIPAPLYWEDVNSVILGANQYVIKAAGLKSLNEYVGKSLYELYPKKMADAIKSHNDEVMRSGKRLFQDEIIADITTGELRYFTAVKAPLYDKQGQIIGIIGTSIDITERKKMEEDLKTAKVEAESANILKTNFIQNMQHDIRTPASGVWAMLDHLVSTNEIPTKELLITLRNSAMQLFTICNDVIDFDKIENGDTPVLSKRFDLREVLTNVIELNQAIAYEKGLNLSYSIDENIPRALKGDEHRLSKIFVNLLGNAIKFTAKGSVSLTAKLIEERSTDYIIHFEVKDTGIGIPKEASQTLYQTFGRLNPANRGTYKGSGLGLRIVKKYLDDMGGEIYDKSELNQGTSFYINIPFEKSLIQALYDDKPNDSANSVSYPPKKEREEPAESLVENIPVVPSRSSGSTMQQANYHVLLIEDDTIARTVAATILKSLSCEVTEAIDVQSALELLKKIRFDCVLSDIGLPDGTGLDIVKTIKKNMQSQNINTPFLALTANADPDIISKGEQAGFLMVMPKPVDKEKMQGCLKKFVIAQTPTLSGKTTDFRRVMGKV